MLDAPTWSNLRKYCRPNMPITAQTAELFKRAANERRKAARVAGKTFFAQSEELSGEDIPDACVAPYSPIGNIRSQMRENNTVGHIIVEAQCLQTYIPVDPDDLDEGYVNSFWTTGQHRGVVSFGTERAYDTSFAWAYLPTDETTPRIYKMSYDDYYLMHYHDEVELWADEEVADGRIGSFAGTDWQGNSPPRYTSDRPRSGSPVTSRCFVETWMLLNKLHCISWSPYECEGHEGVVTTNAITSGTQYSIEAVQAALIAEAQDQFTKASVTRSGLCYETTMVYRWRYRTMNLGIWPPPGQYPAIAIIAKYPSLREIADWVNSLVSWPVAMKYSHYQPALDVPTYTLRLAATASDPPLEDMLNDMPGASWKHVAAQITDECNNTLAMVGATSRAASHPVMTSGEDVWITEYRPIDVSEVPYLEGVGGDPVYLFETGESEWYYRRHRTFEDRRIVGRQLAIDLDFKHFDREALYGS